MRRIEIFSFNRLETTALKPSVCMVISGVMATIATNPNASVRMEAELSPFVAKQSPITKGKINVDVKGPLATPPESNAIAV